MLNKHFLAHSRLQLIVLMLIRVMSSTLFCVMHFTPFCYHVIIQIIVLVLFLFLIHLFLYLLTFYPYYQFFLVTLISLILFNIFSLFTFEMSLTDDSDIFLLFWVVRVEFIWAIYFYFLTVLYHRVIIRPLKLIRSILIAYSTLNVIIFMLVDSYIFECFIFLINIMDKWNLIFLFYFLSNE